MLSSKVIMIFPRSNDPIRVGIKKPVRGLSAGFEPDLLAISHLIYIQLLNLFINSVNKSYFQIQYAYPKAYPGKANSSETPKTADQLSHFEWLQNLRRNPNKVVEKGVAVTPPQNNDASQFSETLSAFPNISPIPSQ
jgi:hypothetical protein